MTLRAFALLLLLVLGLAACSESAPPTVPTNVGWPVNGGDAGKTRHSSLTLINRSNVSGLGLAWAKDLGTNRILEATPLVIDGTMYTSGVAGRVYALNATTGEEFWRFEPPMDMQVTRVVCCDLANRGVAAADGKIYVAALDGWLYALDATTGEVAWKTDTIVDRARGYSSTGAPEVAGKVVVIGNSGSEYDTRGYVSAFDLETGELAWRFWVVPRDPALGPQDHPDLEAAIATWDPESRWDLGGGGASWDAIHFDPETGFVLVGTGNGGPYHWRKRSPEGGDQLYLASLVALDAKTGRLAWYYQETPRDSWDFTSTQPMILTSLEVDGENRPVVIHAPKNGFMYILDRRDGTLLRANSIVRTTWASGVDLLTGRPDLTPESSDYMDGPKIVFPASPGARNWHPASFDPGTGLYYASVLDMGNLIMMTPGQKPRHARALNVDAALIFSSDLEAVLPMLPPPLQEAVEALPAFEEVKREPYVSELRAIDPLTGETRWSSPMAGWQDRAGVLSNDGGLVFQGSIDGTFRAFDSETGELLKSIDTGSSILAAPMTYLIDGIQYIAVMAAWGGGGYPFVPRYAAAYEHENEGRILAFRLGGGPVPRPPELPPLEVAPEPPPQAPGVTPEVIARGQALFLTNCGICHANQHRSITPDLRRMQPATHEAFVSILMEGALVPVGMPRWDDVLTLDDVAALHAFLIDAHEKTRAEELAKIEAGLPLDAPSPAILSTY